MTIPVDPLLCLDVKLARNYPNNQCQRIGNSKGVAIQSMRIILLASLSFPLARAETSHIMLSDSRRLDTENVETFASKVIKVWHKLTKFYGENALKNTLDVEWFGHKVSKSVNLLIATILAVTSLLSLIFFGVCGRIVTILMIIIITIVVPLSQSLDSRLASESS